MGLILAESDALPNFYSILPQSYHLNLSHISSHHCLWSGGLVLHYCLEVGKFHNSGLVVLTEVGMWGCLL